MLDNPVGMTHTRADLSSFEATGGIIVESAGRLSQQIQTITGIAASSSEIAPSRPISSKLPAIFTIRDRSCGSLLTRLVAGRAGGYSPGSASGGDRATDRAHLRATMIDTRLYKLIVCLLASAILTEDSQAQGPTKAGTPLIKGNQRVVVVMVDGLGPDYVEQSPMPVFKGLMAKGFSKTVEGVMPSVTNVNNASICTGTWPDEHGITGNSFLDETKGEAEYMENATYLLRPTLFERAGKRGVKSALLTAKKKTVGLLSKGADVAIAAEAPSAEQIQKYGSPPPIYSREINYWLWEVAVDLLANRPDIGCLYVHTTDYPMHTWPPSAPESKEHLARLDALLGRAVAAAPDAAFLITADHGLNAKTRCWDLAKASRNRGLELRFALSAERDKYVKHHRTFGGTGYVWLRSPKDAEPALKILRGLEGVEAILTREEASKRFHLMPERIGELVVLGDRETVFGELEADAELEHLPPTFRTHGSLHEAVVPLVIYNASGTLPPADHIRANVDLTRTLYRD
jgi:phosphonoacetate hydrolase